MKAIIYETYGGVNALRLAEIEKPVPKDEEVLVQVQAASINDWDFGLLNGDFVNRIINGISKPKRKIVGSDIAGRVVAVGKNVKRFKVGDEVYGDISGHWGGFAEFTCAPEKFLEFKPATMSFVDAASIPQAAMLAVQGLIDVGNIKNGQKVLINGAGGGVGTFGVQIAKQFDVDVTGVDSTSKLDMMRSVGFDHVIDYTREDFTNNGKRYDLIVDAKTNRPMSHYIRSLNPNGTYATVGGSMGRILELVTIGQLKDRLTKKRLRLVALKQSKDLLYMNKLYESGKMRPVIDGPFPMNDFAKAFDIYNRGAQKGKVVITM